MNITFIVILLLIVFLIFYKLYSVLGFHDETNIRKKIKEIKGVFKIENDPINSQINKFEIQQNKQLEDRIFRELDEESKNNLNKIFHLKPEFSLTGFLSHCDFLFTEIFNSLQSKNLKAIEEYVNDKTLEKLQNLAVSYKRTLIKVDKDIIKIEKITIDLDNNVKIKLQITSEQMINYQDQFSQKIFVSGLTIGAGTIDKVTVIKWIVIDFEDL